MRVSLLNKTKPDNYSESHTVNLAGIRWKDYVLIWGGLTDVRITHGVKLVVRSQPRSKYAITR